MIYVNLLNWHNFYDISMSDDSCCQRANCSYLSHVNDSSISKGWTWMSWITWIKTEILYSKFPLNVRKFGVKNLQRNFECTIWGCRIYGWNMNCFCVLSLKWVAPFFRVGHCHWSDAFVLAEELCTPSSARWASRPEKALTFGLKSFTIWISRWY